MRRTRFPVCQSTSRLAKQLAHRILAREFVAEGKLPHERELAARCGVSRATLRGALKILEAQGLVNRFRARGTLVASDYNGSRWFSTATTILLAQVQCGTRGFDGPGTFYGQIHNGVKRMARRLGLTVKYKKVHGYVRVPLAEYTPPTPEEVGGVILSGTFDKQYIQMYQSEGIPSVVVDCWVQDMLVDCVTIDVEAEANIAIQYLAERGHTSVGFLAVGRCERNTDNRAFDPDIHRLLGHLRHAAQQRGIQMRDEWILLAPSSQLIGPVVRQMLRLRYRPTALVSFCGSVTYSLLQLFQSISLRCPEDMSVISRGALKASGRRLTVFPDCCEMMGQQAVRLLAERMQGHRQQAMKVALAPRLVLGTTAGPAPGNT